MMSKNYLPDLVKDFKRRIRIYRWLTPANRRRRKVQATWAEIKAMVAKLPPTEREQLTKAIEKAEDKLSAGKSPK